MRFWDSSAVVPLLIDEPTSGDLLDVLGADNDVSVWWGTAVECMSAIVRRERTAEMAADEARMAVGHLHSLQRSWVEIEPSGELRALAERLLSVHELRAADALQLAAAIVASGPQGDRLDFVCLDRRLAVAAAREGFTVVP